MNITKQYLNNWRAVGLVFVVVLAAQALLPLFIQHASASTLTYTMVRLDRMAANGENSTGTVCAKPATTTAASGVTVKVTFPSSSNFTVNSTAANWTVGTTSTSWPKDPADGTTSATAWPGIATATTVSGQNVTFPSSQLTAGTWYCFNWTGSSTLTVVATAGASSLSGTVTTQNSGPTTVDSGTYDVATVGSSSNGDQIGVTASVNATFSFSLSSNSAALGTLSTSSPSASSAINATVGTNAQRGWDLWAADFGSPVGLRSATANYTIAYSPTVGSTAAALSNGVEGYNVGAGAQSGTCNGSTTINSNFASGGTSFKGGGLDGTMRNVAEGNGTASNCAVPLTVNASIATTTAAATDYAGTVTVVAAGRF